MSAEAVVRHCAVRLFPVSDTGVMAEDVYWNMISVHELAGRLQRGIDKVSSAFA